MAMSSKTAYQPDPIINTHQHSINITNFTSDDIVTYATILLKGTITNCCTTTAQSLFVKCGSGNHFPCTEIKSSHDATGSFKCLIDLSVGKNSIQIGYCNVVTTICIVYDTIIHKEMPIVKVLYILCREHDGCFPIDSKKYDNSAAVACSKIDVGIRLIQCLIAEKLREAGYARRTFRFVDCQPFESKMTLNEAHNWTPAQMWNFLARELISLDNLNENIKYVGLLACTAFNGRFEHVDSNGLVRTKNRTRIAMGVGDVALYSTGCLYTWPHNTRDAIACFSDKRVVDIATLMDDSNGRQTYGGCFATTLGSLCHEIGHIFDLGHTSDGIMGHKFDYVNRFFTHESVTVLLPQRTILSCWTRDMLQTHTANQRPKVTQLKRYNRFLTEYQQQRDNDLTFFCDNSCIMLFYHKWFNGKFRTENPIIFERETRTIKSSSPIKLIEIRNRQCAMAIDYISFKQDDIFIFQLPVEFIVNQKEHDIVVVDDIGNIVRF